ncbi:P-loop containing nucleoside triphosphate hydrolase protein [Radiomyces spectabilis]|uniref:P-loop containing nucleoside triphosphate hydrolase protein n=1 Tax=Radiomyces spectabilis TaxID=64574 RepID=UPI00221F7119|nr:P-loop containing nucleoside triphosphate hydrolase protein [Radiomyces spectabilis]KAI8371668.1 P-loop containing nucleoside triphosphate hydrolase protein [Radiomyces spectabilis]
MTTPFSESPFFFSIQQRNAQIAHFFILFVFFVVIMWSFKHPFTSNCESSNCESFTTRIFNAFQHVTLPSWLSASVPLPNQVVEQAKNIQVVLRYRDLHGDDNEVSPVTLKANPSSPEKEVLFGNEQECYAFDHVFDQSSSQESIFHEVAEPMIEQIMNGYNCAVIACGQSGSGKSFTMQGNMEEFSKNCPIDAGMVPRTLYRLFENLRLFKYNASVQISAVELYDDRLYDLLRVHDDNLNPEIQFDPTTSGATIQGCNEPLIHSADEGLVILCHGMRLRTIGATRSHNTSNRGHCFLTVKVNIQDIVGDKAIIRSGKLTFVDLAGSEIDHEGHFRPIFQHEAASVNKGLLTLQTVIQELANSEPTNSHRCDMLTWLLKDSLGGHTQTCILATASTAEAHHNDTLATLKSAILARHIINFPRTNAPIYCHHHVGALQDSDKTLNAEVKYNEETDQVSMSKELFYAWEHQLHHLRESCQQSAHELEKYKGQAYEEKQQAQLKPLSSQPDDDGADALVNQVLSYTEKRREKEAQVAKLTLEMQQQSEMLEHEILNSRKMMATLSSTIQGKEEQIAYLKDKMTKYELVIQEYDKKITLITEAKDEEIAQLNERVTKYEQLAKEHDDDVALITKRKGEEIAQLKETVAKREKTIENKKDEIKRMYTDNAHQAAFLIEVIGERERTIEEDKKEMDSLKRTIQVNQKYHKTYVQDLETEMDAQRLQLRMQVEELQKLKGIDSSQDQYENQEAVVSKIDRTENQVLHCDAPITTINETEQSEVSSAKGILLDASNQTTGNRKRKVEDPREPLAHNGSEAPDVKEEPPDQTSKHKNRPPRRLKRQRTLM